MEVFVAADSAGSIVGTVACTSLIKRTMTFYERNGFRPSGKVTDFFGMPLFEYVKDARG